MDRLIDLADFDGNGSIKYAEFARVFAADDILRMKKMLTASGGDAFFLDKRAALGPIHGQIKTYVRAMLHPLRSGRPPRQPTDCECIR